MPPRWRHLPLLDMSVYLVPGHVRNGRLGLSTGVFSAMFSYQVQRETRRRGVSRSDSLPWPSSANPGDYASRLVLALGQPLENEPEALFDAEAGRVDSVLGRPEQAARVLGVGVLLEHALVSVR